MTSHMPSMERVRLVRNADLRNARLAKNIQPNPDDPRSDARHDRDRVMYSQAWRRLGGVTQVVTPFEHIALVHNSLTHSEKVAQVARSIAEKLLNDDSVLDLIEHLGGVDADVVEAAALAHDLGHPPFGHVGESELDRIARDPALLNLPEGFEGNAQTFRTVLLTETKSPDYDGLDLSMATLCAVAKYPWERMATRDGEEHDRSLDEDSEYRRKWRKFSVYRTERAAFDEARKFIFAGGRGDAYPVEAQSIEASIMDVADDITYAVHDLEDFFLAGILRVRAVRDQIKESADEKEFVEDLKATLKLDYPEYFDSSLFDAARKSVLSELRSNLAPDFAGDMVATGKARAFGSRMIGQYITSVVVKDEPLWDAGPYLSLTRPAWHQVQILKAITRKFVVSRPDIALLQRGQREVLKGLVNYLLDWKSSDSDFKRLPLRLKQEIQLARQQEHVTDVAAAYQNNGHGRPYAPRGDENRCIVDYLCTLTDGQCYALYSKLSGARPATSAMELFS